MAATLPEEARTANDASNFCRAMRRITKLSTILLVMFALSALAHGPTQIKPGFNLFTKQQDVQLGQELAAQVRKQKTVVKDPAVTACVKAVGKRLTASQEAKASGFPFTFEVIADPSINAFALPGGPMFINTGLLRAVDNEAELAAVMGHEMSHVILRHGTNQASKDNFVELLAMLGGQIADSSGGMMAQLAQLGIGLGANSVVLKFSRTAESQADLMGSHLMAEAGYDPMEMAKFFEKLSAEDGSRAPQFLSDHPNPGNRERAIEQEAARLPERTYGYQTGKFQQMKKALANIHEPPPKPQPAQ
jgi:predicted Zn-dependent protease